MNRPLKATLSLLGGMAMFGAVALAQASGNNAGKEEHHSRFAKVAFWHHHKDSAKNPKPALATKAQSKPAQAKPAQIKGASAKQSVAGKDHRQEQHAGKTSKAPGKKPSTVNKTKAQQKVQDRSAASLKQ